MVRDELVPFLSRRFGTRLPGCALTLRFVGLGQSQIDQKLSDNVTMPTGVIVNSAFGGGRVDFTFSLPDDTPENRQRLDQLKQAIVKCLGDNIYGQGDTTLEEHIIELLKARGETLALVEIGSDGALIAALNGAAGAHQVITGAYVAPTEATLHRFLLGPTASPWAGTTDPAEIARLAVGATNSAWVLVTGPARQEEGQGRYLDVALRRSDGRVDHWRQSVRGSAEMVGSRVSTDLLDQLRRRLRDGVSDATGLRLPLDVIADAAVDSRLTTVAGTVQKVPHPQGDDARGQHLTADDADQDAREAAQVRAQQSPRQLQPEQAQRRGARAL
jgi:nicotinamide-nucleotide amidase